MDVKEESERHAFYFFFQALDEKELLFELAKDICDELDTRTLAHKILQHVGVLTSADRASLFLVQVSSTFIVVL